MKKLLTLLTICTLISAYAHSAENGPVATVCKSEIEKYCSDKEHISQGVRSCLETKKADLSTECQKILDTTGPGKGAGQGFKKGKK